MKITFLGAAETVTGSKILIETKKTRILLDCGLYQGLKNLRLRNWQKLPIDPKSIDAVVLSHAHLDHSGYIPRLYKQGYRGRVYSTRPTRDLSKIILEDSGYLQEEDARWANHKGFSKHSPALPLYTQKDAHLSIGLFETQNFNQPFNIGDLRVSFIPAGHILGASSVRVENEGKSLVYSGDLGRENDVLMRPPQVPQGANTVLMESTYGNRTRDVADATEVLGKLVRKIVDRRSILLIPAFAVGRTQVLLKCLYDLFEADPSLRVPVFVNSPMATDVTELYREFFDFHRLSKDECERVLRMPEFIRSPEGSKELTKRKGPAVIISASGMLTGGRVLHHMKTVAPNDSNIILLAGFQAPGTRGAHLLEGNRELKIHGQYVPVRAEIANFDFLSAHADQGELMNWARSISPFPRQLFLVHGETSASDKLRFELKRKMETTLIQVAQYGESIEL